MGTRAMESGTERYRRLAKAIEGEPLPCAVVDLDALDRNAKKLNAIAGTRGKALRLASKSVRCPWLIRYLTDIGGGVVRGLMTHTATETGFLAGQGHADLLLAYPTAQPSDAAILASLTQDGKTVSVVCDDEAQLDVLDAAARALGVKVRVTIELDVSFRPVSSVHLGGRRSPLHGAAAVVAFADKVRARANLVVFGVMAYEGHIAGSTDKNPLTPLMNFPKRAIKLLSRERVAQDRREALLALKRAGHDIVVMNGGGTGSLGWASSEDALTEVTAGSGYLDSQLFSYYRDLDLEPAAYFALQVVRRPMPGMVTCLGGGYVASGEAGLDRLPRPALPEGGSLLGFEGTGEVQTPVQLAAGVELKLGAPYFFRHAKAGELAEHFNQYLLVRGDRIVERALTYRGLGHCFLG
jgi:D-serine deaminase-like pyridoxal phosphate-dependent protein